MRVIVFLISLFTLTLSVFQQKQEVKKSPRILKVVELETRDGSKIRALRVI